MLYDDNEILSFVYINYNLLSKENFEFEVYYEGKKFMVFFI